MKAKELMDKKFVYISPEDSVKDVSITMEKIRRFTCPVVDDNKHLVGWVTSFEITKGLREGNDKIKEIMSSYEEITTINENAPSRLAVIETANNKFVTVPVLNDDNQVVGMIRACDIVELLSALYDIKVYKLYVAMCKQLKGVTWDELMAAAAIVSKRATGKKVKPEDYEATIREATFGEAIWATKCLENFFAGLISVGELVIARKVGKARK